MSTENPEKLSDTLTDRLKDETKALKEELEEFRKEKEAIRNFVGQIGGASEAKLDKIVNISFIVFMAGLFVFDIVRNVFHLEIKAFPEVFSLEIAVLLVSIKIIWMIHKQTKVEHFQFWILNSIEFRLNDISKKIREIEAKIKKVD